MKYYFKDTDTLGKRIRIIRILKGWTQKELGQKVNLSQSGIYQLESDRCRQTRKIVAFSKVLGVPPEELDPYNKPTHDNKENEKRFELLRELLQQIFPDWKQINS